MPFGTSSPVKLARNPKVDVRVIVFRAGAILLIREKEDGL